MPSIRFLFLITILSATLSTSIAEDDGGTAATAADRKEYVFTDDDGHWFEYALLNCQREGNELFYPESEDEAQAVMEMLPETVDKIWIGIHDNFKMMLLTTDGSKYFYTNWEEGQPDYASFVSPSVVMGRNFKYTVTEGFENHNYVCKKKKNVRCDRTIDFTDYKFMRGAGYMEKESETFQVANLKCATQGGQLFYPETSEEALEVFRKIANEKEMLLVGIADFKKTGEYQTTEGKKVENINWLPGHPLADAHWVHLHKNGTYESSERMYGDYVCKKKIDPECTKLDAGPFFSSDWNEIYKYHAEKKTHAEADMTCKREGGTLAIPRSSWEVGGMMDEFRRRGIVFDNDLWLGYYALKKEFFATVRGDVLENSRYEWTTDYKNLIGCGSLTDLDKFDVRACDTKKAFVCQYDDKELFYSLPKLPPTLTPVMLPWFEALAYCSARGSTIAYPHFEWQTKNMTDLIEDFGAKEMFVGVHNLLGYEKPMSLMGYLPLGSDTMVWVKNPEKTEKICGGLQTDGKLVALDCNTPQRFFCAKLSV